MMLARCRAAWTISTGVYRENMRWMGRGPTIQGRKNAVDVKRTATNANLAREIMRLVAVVNKAKAANMPKDKIEAAIKRGVEGKDGLLMEKYEDIQEATLNLYYTKLPVQLEIETLTDNKRRTAPALRHILGKYNGALGTSGSVAWMFERKGYLEIELPSDDGDRSTVDEDLLIEIALNAGADNVETREGWAQIMCDPNDLAVVRKCFTEAGLEPAVSELVYNPKEFLDLEGEQLETFDKLIDALNEDEDVNQIHHNVNE
ncbi:hypothetical protein DD237_003148 [Peronospora effusa]|uniref:TACO1/YebC-like second and third domain-containing protein n=1 Tax=Peronospora effusa TaxID=542832 RepID=A0A3R7YX72_9STRA|nr:hypothetical protein DD237_003148 [Peronospora effusa]